MGAPERLANQAKNLPSDRCIKLKLNGDRDLDKIRAVRAVQPTAPLWLDANESWNPECYAAWTPHLTALGVELIEQPFPAREDHVLKRLPRPIPVVADESLHTREELNEIRDRYDGINIKLDKTGGLTEALALRDEARALGLKVMIGCMVCTSLSTALAWLLTAGAAWIDLDGPALLERDRSLGATFDGNSMYPPSSEIWGHPRVT